MKTAPSPTKGELFFPYLNHDEEGNNSVTQGYWEDLLENLQQKRDGAALNNTIEYFVIFWNADGTLNKASPLKKGDAPGSFFVPDNEIPFWAAKYAIFKFDPIAEATIEQGQDVKIKEAKAQSENSTVTYQKGDS